MWPGDIHSPSVTMGAPLRAPKQQYIPLQHHAFAEPLFEWVNTSHAFLKLSYETFFCLNPPRMWPGDVYPPSVTMGGPLRAPKQQYIPLQHHAFASHVLLFWCGYSLHPTHLHLA